MVSSRSFLLLAAVLAVAAAASSHAPNRWGLQQMMSQKPSQATPAPPSMEPWQAPAASTNTTGEMMQMMSQMMTIIMPKIQMKLQVLAGNVGRAIVGAMVATFRTGFKTRLTATFTPLEKTNVTFKFPYNNLDVHPPGYIAPGYVTEEEGLRFQETSAEDSQITERQLS